MLTESQSNHYYNLEKTCPQLIIIQKQQSIKTHQAKTSNKNKML